MQKTVKTLKLRKLNKLAIRSGGDMIQNSKWLIPHYLNFYLNPSCQPVILMQGKLIQILASFLSVTQHLNLFFGIPLTSYTKLQ